MAVFSLSKIISSGDVYYIVLDDVQYSPVAKYELNCIDCNSTKLHKLCLLLISDLYVLNYLSTNYIIIYLTGFPSFQPILTFCH